MNNEKKSSDDVGKTYLWIAVGILLIGLIGYNLYSGLTVQKIGIPGIFEIEFGPKVEPKVPESVSVGIPLSAGWKAYGPGAVGQEYKNGIMALNIGGEFDWAQLCLNLTTARRIPELERNPDGTYNLAKTVVNGKVRSDQNFKGYAYVTMFNRTGDLSGQLIEITDVMRSPDGMDIFYEVPDSNSYKDITDMCLTFSFVSNETGSINVLNVTVKK